MTKSFKCPSCGAPLDYEGGNKLTVECPFCSNVVIVPEEIRPVQAAPVAPPAPAAPAETEPDDPLTIREKIRTVRREARLERRELRHQLRKARHP